MDFSPRYHNIGNVCTFLNNLFMKIFKNKENILLQNITYTLTF